MKKTRAILNIKTKQKPTIQANTRCCRTCRYVRPIKKVQFSCIHPSKTIYIEGRGDISLTVKMDGVCDYWESNPLLAKFHKESND